MGTQKAGYGLTWNQRQELTNFNFVPSIYDGEDVAYDDDARGQLNANYTTQTDETYPWDDNGNRTNGGFTPGVNNRLTADGNYTYTYDNEGNLTKRTKITDGSYTDVCLGPSQPAGEGHQQERVQWRSTASNTPTTPTTT